VNDTFPAQNMHLIIAAEVLSGRSRIVIKNLAATLSSNCFILLEETGIFDLNIALKEANLMLIGKQIDSSGKSYFLLSKRKVRKEPILIEITGNDFSWLANAKAALRKFDSENQDVLFVSQSEELLGTYTCLYIIFEIKKFVFKSIYLKTFFSSFTRELINESLVILFFFIFRSNRIRTLHPAGGRKRALHLHRGQ